MTDGWQNRIVGHDDVDPATLAANPANWRVHSDGQAAATTAALDAIGFVRDVIVNRTTGFILDGHLRVKLAQERGEPTVPVAYVELSAAEEALALATFDPLGALAIADAGKLDAAYQQGSMEGWASALVALAKGTAAAPDDLPTGSEVYREKHLDVYLNGDQRQIHVPMLGDEYEAATARMAALQETYDLPRQTDVLLWLLDQDAEAHPND